MFRSKKRPVPVSVKSVITNFLVRINNEPSLSESSISERESVQDVASDHETSQPPTKRSKQRASGFDSSWKQDCPWVTEVEGGKSVEFFTALGLYNKHLTFHK
ncbi:hypothetical protein DPMN_163149 [Dreissena polymorpha]|uniref:Uncharacterized protein n=1 Tax=Dreissena polymorpha TaxID=45954 RepID=A0A9D4EV83_DREPO|nr:hypothetical protein DPMN_163149 [Dreissena polymorpha]